ncbi:MAG: hypothetical protein ISS50_02320 [Anaerolineae bacterium]|nr:hypothetical protein [Anaerolineae bacterium]
MNTGTVYYRRDGPDVLKALLRGYARRLEYVIQERLEDSRFVRTNDWSMGDLWPRGRAFGPELEVRWWEVEPGRYGLLVLSEKDEGLKDGWTQETHEVRSTAEDRPLKVYLWGTHKGQGVWIETRIPRELRYPLDSPQDFAYLEIAEYSRDGMVRFTRFRGLKGEPKP